MWFCDDFNLSSWANFCERIISKILKNASSHIFAFFLIIAAALSLSLLLHFPMFLSKIGISHIHCISLFSFLPSFLLDKSLAEIKPHKADVPRWSLSTRGSLRHKFASGCGIVTATLSVHVTHFPVQLGSLAILQAYRDVLWKIFPFESFICIGMWNYFELCCEKNSCIVWWIFCLDFSLFSGCLSKFSLFDGWFTIL